MSKTSQELEDEKFFLPLKSILIGWLIFIVGLLVVGWWWLWQTTQNPIVNRPTSIYAHPSARSPIMVLTSQALSAVPSPTTVGTPGP